MRYCSRCREYNVEDASTSSWCRPCKADRAKKGRQAKGVRSRVILGHSDSGKRCGNCFMFLELSEFSPSVRGALGLSAYCKVCTRTRYYDRDKAREASYRHRERNREVYLSRHRLHQFNRKKLEKVTADSSVTSEFVKSVYANTECYYCQKTVNRGDRTLEHIIPLAGGGKHTSTNIVMACKYCNSAKQDQSEEEFRRKNGFQGKGAS